uniref:Cytochrome b5 domain containing 1 n=1 Tax=Callorhinchus milii TaxID=7868 RepID=A0A4W3GI74_CALMI
AAGQDISHWFDETTGDIRVEMSQLTNSQKYYTPHGRFVHIPPPMPHTSWFTSFARPWWKDNKYEVGHLTTKTRQIRVINTLTSQEEVIEVCSEETMMEILQRYLKYNAHAASYTWKYNGSNLNMEQTLDENDIKDEDEIFYQLQVDSETFRQAILLYFNDDLTEL